MKDLQRTIYLLVTDPDFRAKLRDDPEAATKSKGLRLSADELAAISELHRPPGQRAGDCHFGLQP